MDFIGRERELGLLEREYRRRSSLVMITGRRRVGKTAVIKRFIEGRDAMYFLATNQNERTMLNDFSEALSRHKGRTYGMFRNWEEALTAFADDDSGKLLLVIDEFQYLFSQNQSFLSVMQRAWDETLSKKDLMMIVCGSHRSVMEGMDKDEGSPMYGRFSRHIIMNPLEFSSVCDPDDFIGSVERYSVLGGVPRYMELFDDGPLRDNVLNNVMDPSAMMFDDPEVLLADEVGGSFGYMSIVKAVAMGNRRLRDISSAVQVDSSTLSPYLRKLTDTGVLTRSVPVTEKDPERSKMGLYSVSDRFTAFWFRFVYPFRSELSLGNTEWAIAMFDRHFVESHVSFVFESVCRSMVRDMTDEIGFVPIRVGSYWGGNVEIDIVAVNEDEKRLFVGECKYHKNTPVCNHVLNELRGKVANVRDFDRFDVVYGLFSVSGFDDRLMSNPDVVLVDSGRVLGHLKM